MDIDAEILARIDAEKAWDPSAKLEDFQIRAIAYGYFLTNLKTGFSQFILDAASGSDDVIQVFPGIFPCGLAGKAGDTGKSSANIVTL